MSAYYGHLFLDFTLAWLAHSFKIQRRYYSVSHVSKYHTAQSKKSTQLNKKKSFNYENSRRKMEEEDGLSQRVLDDLYGGPGFLAVV